MNWLGSLFAAEEVPEEAAAPMLMKIETPNEYETMTREQREKADVYIAEFLRTGDADALAKKVSHMETAKHYVFRAPGVMDKWAETKTIELPIVLSQTYGQLADVFCPAAVEVAVKAVREGDTRGFTLLYHLSEKHSAELMRDSEVMHALSFAINGRHKKDAYVVLRNMARIKVPYKVDTKPLLTFVSRAVKADDPDAFWFLAHLAQQHDLVSVPGIVQAAMATEYKFYFNDGGLALIKELAKKHDLRDVPGMREYMGLHRVE